MGRSDVAPIEREDRIMEHVGLRSSSGEEGSLRAHREPMHEFSWRSL